MSPVLKCATRSGINQYGASQMVNFIQLNTTPQEFDTERKKYPNYQLTYGGRIGWNALGSAADEGNVELVEHIVQIGGKALIELGNFVGFTPLFCATRNNHYLTAKKLIELGANVNIGTFRDSDGEKRNTLEGSTPLWAAAQEARNVALVRLLLKKGAVAEPALESEGLKILDQAQKEIANERTQLTQAIDQGAAKVIPSVLVDLIAAYLSSED
ncbi:MAG: ankyrin repeat domain-containing protein [Chlamydiota bacterium]